MLSMLHGFGTINIARFLCIDNKCGIRDPVVEHRTWNPNGLGFVSQSHSATTPVSYHDARYHTHIN